MAGVLLRKIRSFITTSWTTKLLFAEAVVTSAYVKITLLFLPFRKIAGWLGSQADPQAASLPEAQLGMIEKIRFAIKLCDRYTPWPTECYTRSLTAKIMLKRRKIASTLFFGFSREQGEMKGHAWLKSSGIVVTGFCDFSKYNVHSSFS